MFVMQASWTSATETFLKEFESRLAVVRRLPLANKNSTADEKLR